MKKYVFPIMIGLTAVLLAFMAAFFSITGMGKIFIGWPIMVMMFAIEMGKLMAVSVLYRLWDRLKLWKLILIPMTAIIMLLTSAGIYGFMSSSYENTASGIRTQDSKIELEEKRKESIGTRIKFYQESIDRKQQRSATLSGLRTQQENRMDSLYSKNQIRAAKSVQAGIAQTDVEIGSLNDQTDSLNALIEGAYSSIASIDSTVISMNDDLGKGETGALKYISRTMGISMDSVANGFMLAIMLVFDPLAILLIIVFNIALDKANEKIKDEEEIKRTSEIGKTEMGLHAIDEADEVRVQEVATEQEHSAVTTEGVPEQPVVYETNEKGDFVKMDGIEKSSINVLKMLDKVDEFKMEERDLALDRFKDMTAVDVPQEIEHQSEEPPSKMDKKGLYLALLQVLYQGGKLVQHDHIDAYDRFTGSVVHAGIDCTESEIEQFLKDCVILMIIRIGKDQRIALKSYEAAVATISDHIV